MQEVHPFCHYITKLFDTAFTSHREWCEVNAVSNRYNLEWSEFRYNWNSDTTWTGRLGKILLSEKEVTRKGIKIKWFCLQSVGQLSLPPHPPNLTPLLHTKDLGTPWFAGFPLTLLVWASKAYRRHFHKNTRRTPLIKNEREKKSFAGFARG